VRLNYAGKDGRSYRQIADWLGVHFTTVTKWIKDFSLIEFSTVENSTVEKIEGSDGKQRPD